MKTLLRNAVLALALGSVLWMAGQAWTARRAALGDEALPPLAPLSPATRLVVYYFSQGKECVTCEQIPAYAREALETHFAPQLASGEIVWRAVDVDDTRNAQYIEQYNIFTKSIVLVKVSQGQEGASETLKDVWDLLNSKDAFIEYVRSGVAKALEPGA